MKAGLVLYVVPFILLNCRSALSQDIVKCVRDLDCSFDQYCFESGLCAPCLICEEYHRIPGLLECAKDVSQCGGCLPGFEEKQMSHKIFKNVCARSSTTTVLPTTAAPENKFNTYYIVGGASVLILFSCCCCLICILKRSGYWPTRNCTNMIVGLCKSQGPSLKTGTMEYHKNNASSDVTTALMQPSAPHDDSGLYVSQPPPQCPPTSSAPIFPGSMQHFVGYYEPVIANKEKEALSQSKTNRVFRQMDSVPSERPPAYSETALPNDISGIRSVNGISEASESDQLASTYRPSINNSTSSQGESNETRDIDESLGSREHGTAFQFQGAQNRFSDSTGINDDPQFRSNLNEEDRGSPNEENRSGTRPSVINNVTINMREVDIRANDLSFGIHWVRTNSAESEIAFSSTMLINQLEFQMEQCAAWLVRVSDDGQTLAAYQTE